MTRFIITKKLGAEFVLQSLKEMKGGETFIPKLDSVRIFDLVKFLFQNINFKFIGIRPGEKLHETLIPIEDSINCLEFKNYYLIKPSIKFFKSKNYKTNSKGENGKLITDPFVYSSDQSQYLVTENNIKKILDKIKYKL